MLNDITSCSPNGTMPNRLAASLISFFLIMPAASAETLHVAGAGSLATAFNDLLRRFPAGPDTVATPEFGPSGLMLEKIEAGADVDLFASADMAQTERLAVGHPDRFVVNFTRNRLCAVARSTVGLTPGNMLDRLLDPAVRLATSTPGADPAGDYAWAVFARADAVRAGARAALAAKAQQLYGGGAKTPPLVPGKGAVEGIFLADRADVALAYCSGAPEVVATAPGLAVVSLPPDLAVGPAYGMVVLTAKPVAFRFATYVMSEAGQAVLKAHGFDPVALVEPVPPSPGLLVQRAGEAPAPFPPNASPLCRGSRSASAYDRSWRAAERLERSAAVGCPRRGGRGRSGQARRAGSHCRPRHRGGRLYRDRRLGRDRSAIRRPAHPGRRSAQRDAAPRSRAAPDRPRR
jgi:molybdate transport system substrate-binding protein